MSLLDFEALWREAKQQQRRSARRSPPQPHTTAPDAISSSHEGRKPTKQEESVHEAEAEAEAECDWEVMENFPASVYPLDKEETEGRNDSLARWRIGEEVALDRMYYVPSFVSEEEEAALLRNIYEEGAAAATAWTQLKKRRLQNWGGKPSMDGMLEEPLPEWLEELGRLLVARGVFLRPFNHALINEYEPGQGIMPHEDGPLYCPHVAILSLRSPLLLHIYPKQTSAQLKQDQEQQQQKGEVPQRHQHHHREAIASVLLEPRSLFVFREDVYKAYYHGIDETKEDVLEGRRIINLDKTEGDYSNATSILRDTRVSLTLRVVRFVRRPRAKDD
ncbi:AlkB 6 [Balamuthia mandrillaris]